MADNSPGQVFSPNQGSSEPSTTPSQTSQEVSVPLGRDQTPAAEPQAPIASAPTPQTPTPASEPSIMQEQQTQPASAVPQVSEAPFQPQAAQLAPASQLVESGSSSSESIYAAEPSPYVPEDSEPDQQSQDEAVSWTASEYVAHHKPAGWYGALALVTLVLAAGVYFITDGDIISTVVVVLLGIVFGIYAARKPRVQQYTVSSEGISIGSKTYPFSDLKSFSIIDEGPFSSITFMPLRRFMPLVSIYYDPKDEERIVEFLAVRLPMEDRGHDAIDRLMKKIRF